MSEDRQELKRLMNDPAFKEDVTGLRQGLMARATAQGVESEHRETALHQLWGLDRLLSEIAANNSTKGVE